MGPSSTYLSLVVLSWKGKINAAKTRYFNITLPWYIRIKKNDVITKGEDMLRECNQYFQSVFIPASAPVNPVYSSDINTAPVIPVSGVFKHAS